MQVSDWIEQKRQEVGWKLEYLKNNEPICSPCEQCKYGYQFDEESKQKCNERLVEMKEQKKIWADKVQMLELELEYLNKRRAEIGEYNVK